MRMVCVVLGFVGIAGSAAAASSVPIVTLAPHRAAYNLSLAKVAKGESVRAATGALTYKLTDQCEGYTVESTLIMETAFASGTSELTEQRFAAWESKDGRRATFQMQNFEEGKMARTYRGTVTLDETLAGTITYESDAVTTYKLPPGTLLSTAHTLTLLKSAAAGERFVSRVVVDGSLEEGAFRATAAIGSARDAPAKKGVELPAMAAGTPWPMEVAYFPLEAKKDLPDYEVTMQMHSNGITRGMTQDFGKFAIGFELMSVEALPEPACN